MPNLLHVFCFVNGKETFHQSMLQKQKQEERWDRQTFSHLQDTFSVGDDILHIYVIYFERMYVSFPGVEIAYR